jgi:hypothetical protein
MPPSAQAVPKRGQVDPWQQSSIVEHDCPAVWQVASATHATPEHVKPEQQRLVALHALPA